MAVYVAFSFMTYGLGREARSSSVSLDENGMTKLILLSQAGCHTVADSTDLTVSIWHVLSLVLFNLKSGDKNNMGNSYPVASS